MFHIQLVTDALLSTPGSKTYITKSFIKHGDEMPAPECLCSMYRSPEIPCCEADFAAQAGISHPSSMSAKRGLLYSEILG